MGEERKDQKRKGYRTTSLTLLKKGGGNRIWSSDGDSQRGIGVVLKCAFERSQARSRKNKPASDLQGGGGNVPENFPGKRRGGPGGGGGGHRPGALKGPQPKKKAL